MADFQNNIPQDNIFTSNSNYALFVGKNFGYYADKWQKLLDSKQCGGNFEKLRKNQVKQASFNLSAFFFNILWLAYRKMYLKAISFSAVLIILYFAFGLQLHWSGFIVAILFGLFGNQYYFSYVNSKMEKLEKSIQNPDVRKSQIINTGGTSTLGVMGFLIVYCAVYVLQMPSFRNSFKESFNRAYEDSNYEIRNNIKDNAYDTPNENTSLQVNQISSNEASKCDDENVLNVVKQLFNGILAEEISASIYITNIIQIEEKGYNPELNVRTCKGWAKVEGTLHPLQHRYYPMNDAGLTPIAFVLNHEMVKLGNQW